MKITAQLSWVNMPLSVELRLMTFVPAIFDSQEENHTAPGQLLLTKRSDFPGAEGLARCSPFGGVEFGKTARLGSLLNGTQSPNPVDIPATRHTIGHSYMTACVPNSTGGNGVIHRGLRGASRGSPRPRVNNSGRRIRERR